MFEPALGISHFGAQRNGQPDLAREGHLSVARHDETAGGCSPESHAAGLRHLTATMMRISTSSPMMIVVVESVTVDAPPTSRSET